MWPATSWRTPRCTFSWRSSSPGALRASSGGRMRIRLVIIAILFAVALLVPLLGQPYYTKLAARMAIFALAAMSLDLIVGYAGLVSFGHAAFFGLGCYAAGVLPMAGIQSALGVFPAPALLPAVGGLGTRAGSPRPSGLS